MSENGKALTIKDILAADDAEVQPVPCPAWGGVVYVRTISGDKRDAFDMMFQRGADGKQDLVGLRARLVASCICDEDGRFLNPTPAEIKALGSKSGAMLDRVFDACQVLNGMSQAVEDELVKNSIEADASDSG